VVVTAPHPGDPDSLKSADQFQFTAVDRILKPRAPALRGTGKLARGFRLCQSSLPRGGDRANGNQEEGHQEGHQEGNQEGQEVSPTCSIQGISGKRGLGQPPYFFGCFRLAGSPSGSCLFHRLFEGFSTLVYKFLYTSAVSLPHLLLGLLSRAPATGWDLKARLEAEPALGWHAELAQIYPGLRRLQRAGFVAARRRPSARGPARREYRITLAGMKELRTWLDEPPSLPRPKDTSLARLAFLERRPPDERRLFLLAWRDLVAEALRRAASGTTAARRRRRALLETELAWADAEAAMILSRRVRTA
jgi:PadR family transcriptional regulator AphA